jgi:hypothetical protein
MTSINREGIEHNAQNNERNLLSLCPNGWQNMFGPSSVKIPEPQSKMSDQTAGKLRNGELCAQDSS